jgi:hypothetical protein
VKDILVEQFPISGLEYVFSPPGLPLVTKAPETPGTTSILIRGGAGTGKTTLAVALAHAISSVQGGVTLYLTTEFVVTELAYKAKTLALPGDAVQPWASAVEGKPDREYEPGTILAQHLLMTEAGRNHDQTKSVAGRKRATIEAVWELLARGGGSPVAKLPAGAVVRAVVIDAFGLPEVDAGDDSLRSQLLELVQSLEVAGITTILIEEAGSNAEAWLPFVVDLVFEIDLWPDPDTGDLLRRLKCPKSRYGTALPGPHDYGLDNEGCPAVWPDLVLSPDMEGSLSRGGANQPAAIFVAFTEDSYGLCRPGSVLVSNAGPPGTFGLIGAFSRAPGICPANVDCGPQTYVHTLRGSFSLSQSQGLYALAWELIRVYRDGVINSVVFQGVEFFLAYPRSSIRALRMISMLAAAGLSVCIHGSISELAALEPVAEIVEGKRYRGGVRVEPPQRFLYRADRWIMAFCELKSVERHTSDHAIWRQLLVDDLVAAPAEGLTMASDADSVERSRFALTHHLLGQPRHFNNRLSSAPTLVKASFFLLIGDGLQAAQLATAESKDPGFPTIWAQVSAIYAGNPTAIDGLANTASASHPREAIALMRALVQINDAERLAALIRKCSEWFDLPAWYVTRLKLEYALDTSKAGELNAVIADLEQLSTSLEIPPIHRAEILHNLSIAASRQADQDRASGFRQRAHEINPSLE